MLIEFSVGNYRSFKDVVTFSMVAAPIQHEELEIDRSNIFAANKEISLLRSATIYGANASGKSNLVRGSIIYTISCSTCISKVKCKSCCCINLYVAIDFYISQRMTSFYQNLFARIYVSIFYT